MSLLFLLSLLFIGLLATAAPIPRSTDQWFTVEWDATEFTAMSGNFVAPNAPDNNGIVSLWPGLQGGEDVLQAELTGQSGKWNLQNSFYGSSEELHGSRFQASPGDTVKFSFTRVSSSGLWKCTLSGPDSAVDTFSLPAKSLNRAIFAINILGAQHDFNVLYTDVTITALTPAADWCTTTASNGYDTGHGQYTVRDAIADGTTCHIGQIILPGTA